MTDMGMGGMEHGEMPGMELSPEGKKLQGSVGVDNVAMMPTGRLNRAGEGFPAGRRVLSYADLRAIRPGTDLRPPSREITLHLTSAFCGALTARSSRKPSRLSCGATSACASY